MSAFTGQTVIVTGAGGNLGSAVAHAFQNAGASLALVDRASYRLQNRFPELANSPDHLLVDGVDSTDDRAIGEMVAGVLDRFGRVDVLVNTVGGFRAGTPTHETSFDTWDAMLDLNARTVFIACRAIVPSMLRQNTGKIVNVAARAGLGGRANMGAYSAAKSAVIRLTESMAEELKHQGINVNCILPGTIDTSKNRDAMPAADHSRWVSPEALADVVLFLASESARAIHGAAIPVYGIG